MECNSCEVTYVDGVKCHEHGCPDAWKDNEKECRWCGALFTSIAENRTCCSEECRKSYFGWP